MVVRENTYRIGYIPPKQGAEPDHIFPLTRSKTENTVLKRVEFYARYEYREHI